jgi:hypothetical protein
MLHYYAHACPRTVHTHVNVHVSRPCPFCTSKSTLLHVHANAECSCQCWMSVAMLDIYVAALCLFRCRMSISTPHVYVGCMHVRAACPCCMSMFSFLRRVHAACPRRMSMQHVHSACPCFILVHVHAACYLHIKIHSKNVLRDLQKAGFTTIFLFARLRNFSRVLPKSRENFGCPMSISMSIVHV